MIILFSALFGAHLIADFLLQTKSLADKKQVEIPYLILHCFVHFAVTLLILSILGVKQNVIVLILIFIQHLIIDGIKPRLQGKRMSDHILFLYDQAAHIIILLIISYYWGEIVWNEDFCRILIYLSGIIGVMQFSGILMGLFTSDMIKRNPALENELDNGLKQGGKFIGILERLMIFLFIMIGQPLGAGFIFAAKSLLRMEPGEKHHKRMEYILVGTLFSFLLAILFSLYTKAVLNKLH